MQFRLLLVFLLTAFSASSQVSLYVDSSQSTSGAGTSWMTAYKTLGEALTVVNATATGTVCNVYVAKGTYYPTGAQTSTDRDSSFVMMHGGLRVLGGYPSGGGTRNVAANPTLLSGNIGSAIDSTDNSYHVIIAAGIYQFQLTDSLVLDGLTITHGAATGSGTKAYSGFQLARSNGGGMLASSVWRIAMRNCRLLNNYTSYQGGGINIGASTNFRADSVSFSGNSSATSGGALFSSGAIQVAGSTFTGNVAGNGGAICHSNVVSAVSLRTTSFTGNHALTSSGGAVDVPGNGTFLSQWMFDSLTFAGNSAAAGGGAFSTGGLWTVNTPTIRFRASTFTNNTSATGGGALRLDGTMNLFLDTCSFIANKTGANDGGAVHIGTGTSTLNRVTFTADTATLSGGGALYSGGTLTANFCTFSNNYCLNDGGAFRSSQYTGANLLDCTFDGNLAGNGGGGLYMGTGNVKRCLIRGNRAINFNGGGIFQAGWSLTIDNTLFSGNKGEFGGAFASANWISTTITHCTMAGDYASIGKGVFCNSGATATMKNCIVWEGPTDNLYAFISSGAAITATYSTVQGGYPGTGNISTDPLFVLPLGSSIAATTAGNYALTACSPAINAGQNIGTYVGVNDVAGNPRLDGLLVDQGAYEYQQGASAGTITGATSVCTGSTLQLASTVSGGTWSNPGPALLSVSSTGVVTAGITAGIDTVFYSVLANGCPVQTAQIITVLAPPVIAAITGASTVCVNDSTPLTNTTPGGTWSSSNTALATVSTAGMVTGLAPGTVTIRYKVVNTGGCSDSVSSVLTIVAPPLIAAITALDTAVCPTGTLQLSNATSGGTWSSTCSTGALTVSAAGLVTGVSTGSCTVLYTVTNSNGCTAVASYPVTVYPQPVTPVITGPASVCTGVPATYTATPGGGTWTSGNPSIATITGSGVLTGLTAGSTILTYIYTGTGGCQASSTQPVAVNVPVSQSVAADLCSSGQGYSLGAQLLTTAGTYTHTFTTANGCDSVVTLTLTGSLPPDTTVLVISNGLMAADTPATYQWLRCEANGDKTPLPGQTNRAFAAPVTGSYALSITRSGCTAVSGCHQVTVSANGLTNASAADYTLYPNPTTGTVTVKTSTAIARSLTIQDITGKQLLAIQPTGPETVLSMRGWAPGIYFATITDDAGNSRTIRVSLVSGY